MTDEEFVYHECQGTNRIQVPTYPNSEKLMWIDVCDDCEPHWHSYRYSSAAVFFTEAADRAAELEAFFADYGDINQCPQDLQERANTLKPTPEEWAKYRAPVEVDF